MTEAVVARGLVKLYGTRAALDGLDLTFPSGSLVGFLGPNGAGKTTTFRSLLGLARLDEGEAQVLGHSTPQELAAITPKVGAIVEGPALYETLSGRDNLAVASLVKGIDADIDSVLSQIGLVERAGDRVSGYSKGMRQRLALGTALLGQPELLLLDEPMDGLDPAGQVSLRELLRWLVDQRDMTVVVSSHVLADVEQLVDYVVIINGGKRVAQGRIDELTRGETSVRAVVDNPKLAAETLREAGFNVRIAAPAVIVDSPDAQAVGRTLAQSGVYPSELREERQTLEQLFLRLTEGDGA